MDNKFPRESTRRGDLPRLFQVVDEARSPVGDGVIWHNGTVRVTWRDATTYDNVYETFDALLKTGLGPRIVWAETPFESARLCAVQDYFENSAFASIGGVAARGAPVVPAYVAAENRDEWLVGYEFACRSMYGADWRTCAFGWVAVGEINAAPRPAGPT